MSRIKGKDTKPELQVRTYLYGKGIRYRKNVKLPGKPDVAIKKIKTAIFINGCFWHGHDNCKDASIPKTNSNFWQNKIDANKSRDVRNQTALTSEGWDVTVLWECELKSKDSDRLKALVNTIQFKLKNKC